MQYWDDTLNNEIESARRIIDSVSGMSSDMEKSAALDKADKKIRDAKGTKRSYKMETRLVSDPNQRQMYENKLKRLSDDLSSCTNDLKALRSGAQRGELFLGANTGPGGVDENGMTGEEAGNQMMSDMNTIQDKTKNSLANTANMVKASKEVGEATMEELLKQREQLRNIDNEAMRIEDNLNRADKLIKTFGKRMATDKFIQCFACVNIMLLVGVVIYMIVKKGGLGGDNESAPQDPTGVDATGNRRFLRGFLDVEDPQSTTDWG